MAKRDINTVAEIVSILKVDANLVFVLYLSLKGEHKLEIKAVKHVDAKDAL
jgi:hypothetical protein